MRWRSTTSSTASSAAATRSQKRSAGGFAPVPSLRARLLDQMEFLAPVALWGVLFGALLGMLRISIVFTLPAGALIGTFVVLWTVGGEYFVDLDQGGRLLALRMDFIDWLVIIFRTGYPPQMAPYAIGLGVLMFATAFAAGY